MRTLAWCYLAVRYRREVARGWRLATGRASWSDQLAKALPKWWASVQIVDLTSWKEAAAG